MLKYDPIPWLIKQEGLSAIRARRMLGLNRKDDENAINALECKLSTEQLQDGSFEQSLMKTAGVLNLLDDLKVTNSGKLIDAGSSYLFSILESQPGYEIAQNVKPSSLTTPLDLCGFFGNYKDQRQLEMMALGAREMNFYREYEPLFGPKNPVRDVRKSSFDRVGPSSCYSWGLIPLCYTIETLCRAGYALDERLQPAINVLLGIQRESGGWCRNLGGHPNCTVHAIRAIGSHPGLRQSTYAKRAIGLIQKCRNLNNFMIIQAISKFNFPVAKEIIHDDLERLSPSQRKNGTFGKPDEIERVTAVLLALRAIKSMEV